jgi:hypothetical protein
MMRRRLGECASKSCTGVRQGKDADGMVPSMWYHHPLTNLHELVLPALLGPFSSPQDPAISTTVFV